MNKERLLKVADLIQEHADRYDQREWGQALDRMFSEVDLEAAEQGKLTLPDLPEPTCGTGGCIAGFAANAAGYSVAYTGRLLKGNKLVTKRDTELPLRAPAFAEEWLGLSEDVAESLFASEAEVCWPQPWAGRYRSAATQREKAGIAADLLRAMAHGKVIADDFS